MPDPRPADGMIARLAARGITATKADGYEIQVEEFTVEVGPAGWSISTSFDESDKLDVHVTAALDAITAIVQARLRSALPVGTRFQFCGEGGHPIEIEIQSEPRGVTGWVSYTWTDAAGKRESMAPWHRLLGWYRTATVPTGAVQATPS